MINLHAFFELVDFLPDGAKFNLVKTDSTGTKIWSKRPITLRRDDRDVPVGMPDNWRDSHLLFKVVKSDDKELNIELFDSHFASAYRCLHCGIQLKNLGETYDLLKKAGVLAEGELIIFETSYPVGRFTGWKAPNDFKRQFSVYPRGGIEGCRTEDGNVEVDSVDMVGICNALDCWL